MGTPLTTDPFRNFGRCEDCGRLSKDRTGLCHYTCAICRQETAGTDCASNVCEDVGCRNEADAMNRGDAIYERQADR